MRTSTREERQELYEMLKTPYEQTAAGKFMPKEGTPPPSPFSDGQGVSGGMIRLGDDRSLD